MIKGKALILAKVEATYGTDAAPVVGTDAILTETPDIDVMAKSLERPNVRTFLGARPRVNIGEGIKLKFTTEIKGGGNAGVTAPEIGPLFRGCGYTQTVNAGVSHVYTPNSNILTAESLTIWFYYDGMINKVTGCRGTYSVDLKAGEYGKISWEFTGLFAGALDLALGTGTFNAAVPPKWVSGLFTLDSYAGIISAIKITGGNTIAQRKSANAATGILEYFIKERSVTGEADPELVTIATKDFWTMFTGSSQVAFTTTLGSAAGNKCVIAGPKVQLSDIKYGERESLMTYQLPLVFTPNTGNDEITFTFN